MQSVLEQACMLMGSAKRTGPGRGIQGSVETQKEGTPTAWRVPVEIPSRRRGRHDACKQKRLLTNRLQKMLAMTLILLVGTWKASAYWAYEYNNQIA
jgi:hypothetical protein